MLVPMVDILINKYHTASPITTLPSFSFDKDYINQLSLYYFQKYKNFTLLGLNGPLVMVCIVLVLSNLISNICKYLGAKILHLARYNVLEKVKQALFDKLLHSDVAYFTNERKGDLLSKFTFDMVNIEYLITDSLKGFIRDPLTLFFYLVFLIFLSWKLTLLALIVLPLGGYLISTISRKLKKMARSIDESNSEMLSITDEAFTGMRIVKSFTAEKFIGDKFHLENEKNVHARYTHDTRLELSSSLSEFFGILMVAIILYIGGGMVLHSDETLKASEFMAYLGLFSQVITPAKSLVQSINMIQKGLLSCEKIFAILDKKESINDDASAIECPILHEGIRFENVSFKYENTPVLKNINLFIPKGKTVALVGASGSGKSTLADLISRFYDIQEGSITFDGVDIKTIKQSSLRNQIGIVSQEALLINDTVAQNISFGKKEIDRSLIIKAAQAANAHNFITSLEQGYDTFIGERGNKLSGGQKQRISIARALLKNPHILILDEATSALDTESEVLVQAALENLLQNRTSIVIAHRLSTIMNADIIAVLHEGKIAELGTHVELIARQGLYYKLVNVQSNSST
jgi:ATP-binding cassette, subfamily B, bacterial MsbA